MPTCLITGTVVDPDGNPAPFAQVTFTADAITMPANTMEPVVATADGSGAISISLLPGPYRVRIRSAGGRYFPSFTVTIPAAETADFTEVNGSPAVIVLSDIYTAANTTMTKAAEALLSANTANTRASTATGAASTATSKATEAAAMAELARARADDIPAFAGFRDAADLTTLLANSTWRYDATGAAQVVAGDVFRTRKEGFSYVAAASGASDHHLTTAGGLKLYVSSSRVVNVKAFGAKGDGGTDDTAEIQGAINYCRASGLPLHIPAGSYLITSSLVISDRVKITGAGRFRTRIRLATASTTTFAIDISIPDETACVGLELSGFQIVCNHGAVRGCGINIKTADTNSAISQSRLRDIYITHCTRGVEIDGVVYMNNFDGITISGQVAEYGWYIPNTDNNQVIYNTFENLEVTNILDNAYGYWSKAYAGFHKNLTADGCCYFHGFYSTFDGVNIENIYADVTPSNAAIEFLQVASVTNVGLMNIPNAKCLYGIKANSGHFRLSGVLVPDMGAGNQPNRIINLYAGGTGVIENIHATRSVVDKIETYLSEDILNGFVFTDCGAITDVRDFSNKYGAWTPGYSSWTTPPATVTARYTKIGRMVVVQLFGQGGVCTTSSKITGLPLSSSPLVGAPASLATTDAALSLIARLGANATEISNFPARDFADKYWNLSVTYTA